MSGGGCGIRVFLLFGPLLLKSYLQWATLGLVLLVSKVLLWPCLLLLPLGLRGSLVLAGLFVVWFLLVVVDSCILLFCMAILVRVLKCFGKILRNHEHHTHEDPQYEEEDKDST